MSDSEKNDSKSSGEAFQFFAGLTVSVLLILGAVCACNWARDTNSELTTLREAKLVAEATSFDKERLKEKEQESRESRREYNELAAENTKLGRENKKLKKENEDLKTKLRMVSNNHSG
jgi:predicted nuclease with TOPRIM domain